MNNIWKLEVIFIIIMIALEPTVNSINIILSIRFNYDLNDRILNNISIDQINSNNKSKKDIFKEIKKIENKTLVFNKTIGSKIVKYWEHEIDDILYVKNDSIILHIDRENKNIIFYKKTWTDIKINISKYKRSWFEPKEYCWKKIVIFPDYNDCKKIYTIDKSQKYPIICLEVKHTNGKLILYNKSGKKIGMGVPAPSYHGLSLSGFDKGKPHDIWRSWRENANYWFKKWFGTTICIGLPSNEQISKYLSNPYVKYFYEIAHSGGESTRFQTNGNGIFYTANMLKNDMKDRDPIKLAFFCSCEAMRRIDNGTLSYEIRKGEMENTVTIGYIGMGNSTGWYYSLDWQNALFIYLDRGFSIKNAFLLASSIYPTISDNVRFVGDEDLKIKKINNTPFIFFDLGFESSESFILISSIIITFNSSFEYNNFKYIKVRDFLGEIVQQGRKMGWIKKFLSHILTN